MKNTSAMPYAADVTVSNGIGSPAFSRLRRASTMGRAPCRRTVEEGRWHRHCVQLRQDLAWAKKPRRIT